MSKSPERIGGNPEGEKRKSFEEILSMTPDKLTDEIKGGIVEKALEEELKPEMLTESLRGIESEIRGEGKIFDDISPFRAWIMGEQVTPEDTTYPFRKWEEKESRTEYVTWMKSFLERVKQEANRSNLPHELDFTFEQDESGTIHIILKVNKKESGN